MSRPVVQGPTIDLNSTRKGEILFVQPHTHRILGFELVLVDVVRDTRGTLNLIMECRFHSSEIQKDRFTACDVDLLFSTPDTPTSLSIPTQPTIEGPPQQETEVLLTTSCRITAEAAVSYVASLRAKLTRSTTQRYRVTEKEKREGSKQGLHGVNLRFHENVVLRKGLDGERRIAICVEDLEGSTCIRCICTTRLRYTVVHTFGVTTSHSKIVDTVFELKL